MLHDAMACCLLATRRPSTCFCPSSDVRCIAPPPNTSDTLGKSVGHFAAVSRMDAFLVVRRWHLTDNPRISSIMRLDSSRLATSK